jgi:hypothetical protein
MTAHAHLLGRISQLEAALRAAGVPVPPWAGVDERYQKAAENFRRNGTAATLGKELGISGQAASVVIDKWWKTLPREEKAKLLRERAHAYIAAIPKPRAEQRERFAWYLEHAQGVEDGTVRHD